VYSQQGLTVTVGNTDAEGRLVLADGMGVFGPAYCGSNGHAQDRGLQIVALQRSAMDRRCTSLVPWWMLPP
jgi:hypothetical protein